MGLHMQGTGTRCVALHFKNHLRRKAARGEKMCAANSKLRNNNLKINKKNYQQPIRKVAKGSKRIIH